MSVGGVGPGAPAPAADPVDDTQETASTSSAPAPEAAAAPRSSSFETAVAEAPPPVFTPSDVTTENNARVLDGLASSSPKVREASEQAIRESFQGDPAGTLQTLKDSLPQADYEQVVNQLAEEAKSPAVAEAIGKQIAASGNTGVLTDLAASPSLDAKERAALEKGGYFGLLLNRSVSEEARVGAVADMLADTKSIDGLVKTLASPGEAPGNDLSQAAASDSAVFDRILTEGSATSKAALAQSLLSNPRIDNNKRTEMLAKIVDPKGRPSVSIDDVLKSAKTSTKFGLMELASDRRVGELLGDRLSAKGQQALAKEIVANPALDAGTRALALGNVIENADPKVAGKMLNDAVSDAAKAKDDGQRSGAVAAAVSNSTALQELASKKLEPRNVSQLVSSMMDRSRDTAETAQQIGTILGGMKGKDKDAAVSKLLATDRDRFLTFMAEADVNSTLLPGLGASNVAAILDGFQTLATQANDDLQGFDVSKAGTTAKASEGAKDTRGAEESGNLKLTVPGVEGGFAAKGTQGREDTSGSEVTVDLERQETLKQKQEVQGRVQQFEKKTKDVLKFIAENKMSGPIKKILKDEIGVQNLADKL